LSNLGLKTIAGTAALCATALCVWTALCLACGPNFPDRILDKSDADILKPPYGNFQREIEKIELEVKPTCKATTTRRGSPAGETSDADMADLRTALKLNADQTPKRSLRGRAPRMGRSRR
jgi:hypothetical protein